jgi:PAS domain S-box-containing protein
MVAGFSWHQSLIKLTSAAVIRHMKVDVPANLESSDGLSFLQGGGEMGERIRAFDWLATPLGEPAFWPPALKTLVELLLSSKQPMFLAWGKERVWLYNEAFIPIAGRKHPASLGRASREVWSEAWQDLEPLFNRVFNGEAVHMTGFSLGLDRAGAVEEAHFDFSYTPVRGGGQVVNGLYGVCIETTDRVLDTRRQAIAAEFERGRIFEMSRDLFAVATFDGFLKSINPAWSRLLERSHDDLVSRPFSEIIHPDDLAITADVIAALQRGEPVHQFLVRLLKADGTAVSFAWSAVPEGDSFYTVGRDISDDERREEALRHSQKMEAVGQLTGGLAHDFNNLLQAVHGNLDLIRRKPEDPQRVVRLAEHGLQATERGAKLTAQLLAFSRSQKFELRPIAVADLIAGMDDILERSLDPLIHVTLDMSGDGLNVIADQTQLEMALLNLAINARDAMPEGGDLAISVRELPITRDPDLPAGRYVEIRVTDTGTGMLAEIAARAFDPFFTTKGVGKGTGLGLSQVYGMAKQAGGIARIEDHKPRGTSVLLLLKSVERPVDFDHPVSEAPRPAQISSKTILVVDDDPDVRQFLSASLHDLGFRVIVAEDGPSALLALEKSDPDILLLDFAMPGMNGAEVAGRVRTKRPELPIVFASGFSDSAAIVAAVGESASLLKKPFSMADLEAELWKALRPNPSQN